MNVRKLPNVFERVSIVPSFSKGGAGWFVKIG